MDVITENYKEISKVIDIELNKVRYLDRADLKQLILLKLCERVSRGDVVNVGGMCRVICRYTIIDYYRARKTTINIEDLNDSPTAPGTDPLYAVAGLKADIEYLHSQYILSDSEYEILRLMIYSGKTQKESADIVGVHKSAGTRAVMKIRSI